MRFQSRSLGFAELKNRVDRCGLGTLRVLPFELRCATFKDALADVPGEDYWFCDDGHLCRYGHRQPKLPPILSTSYTIWHEACYAMQTSGSVEIGIVDEIVTSNCPLSMMSDDRSSRVDKDNFQIPAGCKKIVITVHLPQSRNFLQMKTHRQTAKRLAEFLSRVSELPDIYLKIGTSPNAALPIIGHYILIPGEPDIDTKPIPISVSDFSVLLAPFLLLNTRVHIAAAPQHEIFRAPFATSKQHRKQQQLLLDIKLELATWHLQTSLFGLKRNLPEPNEQYVYLEEVQAKELLRATVSLMLLYIEEAHQEQPAWLCSLFVALLKGPNDNPTELSALWVDEICRGDEGKATEMVQWVEDPMSEETPMWCEEDMIGW